MHFRNPMIWMRLSGARRARSHESLLSHTTPVNHRPHKRAYARRRADTARRTIWKQTRGRGTQTKPDGKPQTAHHIGETADEQA